MPRNWSKALPEVNVPVPQQEEFGPDQPTLADVYRFFEESFDRQLKIRKSRFDQQDEKLNESMEEMRATEHSSASLEQDVRQPHLAMQADVTADKKTRERTEGAAAAVQAKYGDSCSAKRIQAGPTSSTSFGIKAEPPALPRWDHILVDKGATTPKPRFSSAKMRTRTAASGLLPAGTASTATRTPFDQPPLWFCPTEEINLRTSDQYATDYSSLWEVNVSQTKLMQTMVFDPGGFKGCIRAYPLLGTWHALLCGEVFVWAPAGGDLECFWQMHDSEHHIRKRGQAVRTYCS